MTGQLPFAGLCTPRNANATIPIKSKVDRPVSQRTAGSQMRGKDTAQNVPARFAAGAPKIRQETCMMTATVSTANNVCSPIITAPAAKL